MAAADSCGKQRLGCGRLARMVAEPPRRLRCRSVLRQAIAILGANLAPSPSHRDCRGGGRLGLSRTPPAQAIAIHMTQLVSVITCPNCGHKAPEHMPTDACQFFYECKGCGDLLRPKAGDCCVFCSYGDMPCPPIQEARAVGQSSSCCGGGCHG